MDSLLRIKKGKTKMKKIMILAVAAFAAFIANAASVDWKITAGNMYAGNATDKYTGTFEVYATGGDLTEDVKVFTQASVVNGTVANVAFQTSNLTVGEKYDFYIVLTKGDLQFTSTVIADKVAAETGSTLLNFGNMATQTQNAANWTSAAVPEPTSGLLLLLGVAGLALRRKKA
jgi:hypothetical protein